MSKPSDFPEWIATLAFYKAVHVVEAVFRCQGRHNCHDHITRLDTLKRLYDPLHQHFRPLYSASLIARYLEQKDKDTGKEQSYTCFTDYISPQKVIDSLIRKRLVPLENIACEKYLSDQCKQSLTTIHVPNLPKFQ
jgi:hypothetical protein